MLDKVTREQAAQRLGISTRTLGRRTKSGEIEREATDERRVYVLLDTDHEMTGFVCTVHIMSSRSRLRSDLGSVLLSKARTLGSIAIAVRVSLSSEEIEAD